MPDDPRIVVTNTTPIIALSLIDKLDLLGHLYGSILVPPAVSQEIKTGGHTASISTLVDASYLKITKLSDPQSADLLSDLDRGEAEAIALSLEMSQQHGPKKHLLIIDERLGRRHARRLGLTITGTLGILLKGKREGHIEFLSPLIDRLMQGGIFLGDELVKQVLKMAGE